MISHDMHPLDRPVWSALTSQQADLAMGSPAAWRFPPDISDFGAPADFSAASISALCTLAGHDADIKLAEREPVAPPPGMIVTRQQRVHQMVQGRTDTKDIGTEDAGAELISLGADDASDMLALARLTRPGSFFIRTPHFGGFIGIREKGDLVAMAGTRLRPAGFIEVSGVCTHPDYRGRGLGEKLVRAVAGAVHAGGLTPFLHVFPDNKGAVALYARLGFALRRDLFLTVMAHRPPEN